MGEEVSGDRSLTFDTISSFNQVQQQSSIQKNVPKHTKSDIISNALSRNIIRPLSEEFDRLIEKSFSDYYGGFFSITDPVLESDIVTILIQKMKESLPRPWL